MRFERYLKSQIDRNNKRLTAITGAPAGTRKTTMLLQHIKEQDGNNPENVLFVSLDNVILGAEFMMDKTIIKHI